MTVVVLGTLRFPASNIEAILPRLRELVETTRRLDGCISYDVGVDPFDRGLLRFSEIWPDAAALDAHLSAPHIAPWRAASAHHGLIERSFTAYDATGSWPV